MAVSSGDVYVEAGASGGDGSASNPYGTIQAGVDNATPGANVIVRSGTYEESVEIEKSVHVLADDGALMDGSTVSGPAFRVENTSHPLADVTVRGFAIEHYDTGILVASCNQAGDGNTDLRNVAIEDNTISDVDRGIALDLVDGTSEGLTVADNTVSQAREKGISVFVHGSASSDGITIENNDLSASVDGPAIRLWAEDTASVSNPTIDGNDGSGAAVGLEVYVRNSTSITGLEATDNRFSDTDEAGIEIATGGVTDATLEDLRIVGNALDGSGGEGILVDTTSMSGQALAAAEFRIEDNELDGNEQGVVFELSEESTVEGVTIVGNSINDSDGSGNGIDVVTTDDATVRDVHVAENGIARSAGDGVRLAAQGGAISNVTLLENELVASGDDAVALETHGGGVIEAVWLERNRLVDSGAAGIEVRSTTDASEVSAHYNVIDGNAAGVDNQNENEIVDARFNWWGDSSGPSTAAGASSAPVADPVSGALADGQGDSVSEGATDGVSNVRFQPAVGAKTRCADDAQLHDPVPDREVEFEIDGRTVSGQLGDFLGLCVWERAPLPFSADHGDAATKVRTPQVFLNTSGGDLQIAGAGTNRPYANVFQAGEPITLSYHKVTGADTTRFAGEDAKLLLVRANATDEATGDVSVDVDTSTGEITLGTDAAEFVETRDLGQIDAGGSLDDFDVTPSESGVYLALVATVEDGEGVSVTPDGNLTFDAVRTGATVVGGTVLAVQETDSTVTPNRTAVEPGEAVAFDADSNLRRDDLAHALVLYDEETFADTVVTVDASLERDNGDLVLNVSGTADGESFYVRVDASTDGALNALTVSGQLDGVDSDVTTVRSGDSTETLVVETGADWREGTYRWVHAAVAEDDASRLSTDAGTVTVGDDAERTKSPDIELSPTSVDFGEGDVGGSEWRLVEVSNVGDAPLKVHGSSITGADTDEFRIDRGGLSARLAPGESYTVKVRFEPTSGGERTATLEVASNDTDESTVTASLSGTGESQGSASPDIAVSPSSVDFGEVDVGGSEWRLVEVSNDGDAPLHVTGSDLTGDDEFRIDRGGLSALLSPGEAYTVKVRFEPDGAGNRSATLEVASNDTDESTVTVPLAGNGTTETESSTEPTTTTTWEPLSVDVYTSEPGNASIRIRNVEAGDPVNVTFDDAVGYDGIYLDGLDLELDRYANAVDLEIRHWETAPEEAPSLEITGDAERYVEVDKSGIADDGIEEARFHFRMTESALGDRDPTNVALHRYDNGTWSELSTTFVERRDGDYVFTATSPGFSAFAVGVQQAQAEVTGADLSSTNASVGEEVTVTATIENTGDVAGTFTAGLAADGETVATRDVSLDAGESTAVEFGVAFDEAGEYDLAVNETDVGTLSVRAESTTPDQTTTTESSTAEVTTESRGTTAPPTGTNASTTPGTGPDEPAIPLMAISLIVTLLVALAVAALYFRTELRDVIG